MIVLQKKMDNVWKLQQSGDNMGWEFFQRPYFWFHFNYDFRNQRLKLREYTYYQNNQNWKVFGTLSNIYFA